MRCEKCTPNFHTHFDHNIKILCFALSKLYGNNWPIFVHAGISYIKAKLPPNYRSPLLKLLSHQYFFSKWSIQNNSHYSVPNYQPFTFGGWHRSRSELWSSHIFNYVKRTSRLSFQIYKLRWFKANQTVVASFHPQRLLATYLLCYSVFVSTKLLEENFHLIWQSSFVISRVFSIPVDYPVGKISDLHIKISEKFSENFLAQPVRLSRDDPIPCHSDVFTSSSHIPIPSRINVYRNFTVPYFLFCLVKDEIMRDLRSYIHNWIISPKDQRLSAQTSTMPVLLSCTWAPFDCLRYNSLSYICRCFLVGYLVWLRSPFDAIIARNYFNSKTVSFINIDWDPVLLHLNDHLIDPK